MAYILLTGGAGMIGQAVMTHLQAQNHCVLILDNFSTGSYKNLAGFNGKLLVGDLRDASIFEKLKEKRIDLVIHLGGITDPMNMNEQEVLDININGFQNILDFCEFKYIPVIFASSCAIYGKRNSILKEVDPAAPLNVYAYSKYLMEQMAAKSGIQYIGLRFSNIFSHLESAKGRAASMIYQMTRQYLDYGAVKLFEDGNQCRDWFYAGELASLIGFCVDSYLTPVRFKLNYQIFNAGSGESHSFNELAAEIAAVLGIEKRVDYISNPAKDRYQEFTECDMSKLKSFGWENKSRFKDNLKLVVNRIAGL